MALSLFIDPVDGPTSSHRNDFLCRENVFLIWWQNHFFSCSKNSVSHETNIFVSERKKFFCQEKSFCGEKKKNIVTISRKHFLGIRVQISLFYETSHQNFEAGFSAFLSCFLSVHLPFLKNRFCFCFSFCLLSFIPIFNHVCYSSFFLALIFSISFTFFKKLHIKEFLIS